MFSAHQLHTEEILRLAVQTSTGQLAARGISLQSAVLEHGTGLVVINSDITWERKFNFFTATSMVVDSEMRLRDDGQILHCICPISAAGKRRIDAKFSVRPVRLSGSDALDAAPARFEGPLRGNYTDDEIDASMHSRTLQTEIDEWIDSAEVLGEHSETFRIRRTDCEFADQWKFTRLPAILSNARDELAYAGSGELSYGLSKPIKRFRSEWWRPMYLGDFGRVELQVVRHEGTVHFTRMLQTKSVTV